VRCLVKRDVAESQLEETGTGCWQLHRPPRVSGPRTIDVGGLRAGGKVGESTRGSDRL
jgi:hypothetical protein